ncbi:MAG: hypothetical protein JWN62_2815 [Acidimicrobiales bacterium]|nr:hypothetical protein [Acidimicrobiales bacterium]
MARAPDRYHAAVSEQRRGTSVAADIDEVTPEWLTARLRDAGIAVDVAELQSTRVGTGQIGASYRVVPTSTSPHDGAPASFIVKLATGSEAVRQRVAAGFAKEVAFYSTIAATVVVRTPRCWHAAIADDTLTFSLLLEDLAPAVPGVQKDGCSVAQAHDALRNLAGLHAPRWNDPGLLGIEVIAPPDAGVAVADFLGATYADAAEQFTERYRDELDPTESQIIRDVGPVLARWQMARPRPFTVTHGDYRLDNLMFPTEGDGVSVLDWQTVAVAPPSRDVAYFLGNSLDPSLRRDHEHALIDTYVRAPGELGVTDYPAAACFQDYRFGQLQGPMITVLGCMFASSDPTPASDEMFLTMARRSCAAIRDLGTLELVAVA